MKELGIYLGEEKLGLVHVESVRGKEVFSFSYDDAWLKKEKAFAIDPDVLPSAGEQYPVGKEVFGFLGDIAPDRWGGGGGGSYAARRHSSRGVKRGRRGHCLRATSSSVRMTLPGLARCA